MEKHGPAGVLITSLTKAAATEIANRETGVLQENVGTLHSICFRSRRPRFLLDSPKGIKEWNQHCQDSGHSLWKLSSSERDPDDPLVGRGGETTGDTMLEKLSSLRHRMVDPDEWDPRILPFADEWMGFGREVDAVDFSGLIEHGMDLDAAPGNPRVIIGDEVQDRTKLEATVFRRWAENADSSLLAGDADQTLYEWRWANPRIFLDHPVPEYHRRLLGQSWRVPRAVHRIARTVIRRILRRDDPEYLPRDEEGAVHYLDFGSWRRPEAWLDQICYPAAQANETSVVLTPCSYQLSPLLHVLRREGIPFCNPYRRKRGDWNPLVTGGDRDTAANQLLAYLSGTIEGWSTGELARWIPLLRSTVDGALRPVLAHGAKVGVGKLSGPIPTSIEYHGLWRDPADGHKALERNVDWLASRMNAKDLKRLDYTMEVHRRGGLVSILEQPKLMVGTIHSFKGAEADHVFIVTALPARWAEMPDSDELIRLFYVALTRARKSVTILCGDRGGFRI